VIRPTLSDVAVSVWEKLTVRAAIVEGSRRANRFGTFGSGSLMCFPTTALFGEPSIHIGRDTTIGPYCSVSVGMVPGQDLFADRMLTIGDRCVIGRGSAIRRI